MNQNAEQLARDAIDPKLQAAGWIIQDKKTFNLADGEPLGIIEAKRKEGVGLTIVVEQSVKYASAKLEYIKAAAPLFFA